MKYWHEPVLPAEALHYLNCSKKGTRGTFVDCTLGGAGQAEAILNLIAPEGILVGIDQDVAAIKAARDKLRNFSRHFHFVKGDFRDLDKILSDLGVSKVKGVLFDLGVSAAQLEIPERGFSYSREGPLDMRMDVDRKVTAADIVNTYSEDRLAMIIYKYAEEKWAKRIARFIVEARARKPIKTTSQLVKIIKDAIPASARRKGPHPAKRVFQALRIEVNQELKDLDKALTRAVFLLEKKGRLVVISYHSLEDRVAKDTLRELAAGCVCPPSFPVCQCGRKPAIKILTKKPVTPSEEETKRNPRARSARLRAAERI